MKVHFWTVNFCSLQKDSYGFWKHTKKYSSSQPFHEPQRMFGHNVGLNKCSNLCFIAITTTIGSSAVFLQFRKYSWLWQHTVCARQLVPTPVSLIILYRPVCQTLISLAKQLFLYTLRWKARQWQEAHSTTPAFRLQLWWIWHLNSINWRVYMHIQLYNVQKNLQAARSTCTTCTCPINRYMVCLKNISFIHLKDK